MEVGICMFLKDELDRLREVLGIAGKYGFGEFIRGARLEQNLPITSRWISPAQREFAALPRGEKLRLMLTELGPTFIKLGQVLSTREDLLPEDVISELKKLQDRLPPMKEGEAIGAIEKSLHRPIPQVFRKFERKPVAAASIAQVHRATLKTGEKVIVKVRRRGIEDTVRKDMKIMMWLARAAERYIPESRRYSPVLLVDRFDKEMRDEMDFRKEGRNTDRFARNFGEDETVVIPKMHWDYTGDGVLVQEHIDGVKLDELEGEKLKREVIEKVVIAYLKQILELGFFQADPHPGNILITKDGRVGIIDFGRCVMLTDTMRERLEAIFLAIVQKDARAVADEFVNMGVAGEETDVEQFRADIEGVIKEYYDVSIEQVDVGFVLRQIMEVSNRDRARVPPELVSLIRTLIIIEGIARSTDPKFNLIRTGRPFFERIMREKTSPKNVISEGLMKISRMGKTVSSLPVQTASVLSMLERGTLKIDLEHKGFESAVYDISSAMNRLSISLILASIIIASSFVLNVEKGLLGTLIFIFALVLGFVYLLKMALRL
ncbi:MAG: AarF/UbiB family protein [Candidatus Micrarchaeota archaeon]|nr:AarF/UbiB family protein [Candidatus Micrarchaeota archaeon]